MGTKAERGFLSQDTIRQTVSRVQTLDEGSVRGKNNEN